MDTTYLATGDISVIPYFEPAGPLGFLPINAYLIKGREPILVETSLYTQTDAFLEALRGEIDPGELRWIFITHEDLDHAGGVERLMAAAPRATLVLSFLAMLKFARMDITTPDRIYIATPGEAFSAGDRRFGVIQPPVFDSSATVAYFDERTRALFSADSFGGLVPLPTGDMEALGDGYWEGSRIFMSANSAWLHGSDPARFPRAVNVVRTLDPQWVMPTHGAPMQARSAELCDHLVTLPARERFLFPNDAAFRAMLEQMKTPGKDEAAA